MSLKLKVFVILLAVFAGLFAANALVLRFLLWPSFASLELRKAEQDVERVSAALDADSIALHDAVVDWAIWDDVYSFAQGRNPGFVSSLVSNVYDAHHLDLHYVVDARGNRIGGKAFAPGTRTEIELKWLPPHLPKQHFLRSLMHGREGVAGFVRTERGPLMIAAHPILTADKSGSPAGLMIMGRFMTEARVAELGRRVDVPVELSSATPQFLPPSGQSFLDLSESYVDATAAVPGLLGPPAMVLHAKVPREITASGASAINFTLAALIVTAGVVLLVVLAVIQYLAVNPLARLTSHVKRLAETGNLAEHLHEDRNDEFGYLAREFNRMQWRVSRLAFYDPLTELPNRFMFSEHMRRALSRAERTGRLVAVYYLDLDGFKQVNDTLSHAVGDALLRQVAQRFRANLRGCDIIARLGGDEFTVLVEDLKNEDGVGSVAEKILRLFDKPFTVGEHRISITTSIGVSLYPRSGANVDELLLAADIAMYSAKRAGPGRFHLYNEQEHHHDLASGAALT